MTRTVGLFPEDARLHYVDADVVIATSEGKHLAILRNGSSKSLNYALKLTNFSLLKGGSWMKRPDGLNYHLLEAC